MSRVSYHSSRKSWSTALPTSLGGGFIENVPRMFAADLAAEIEGNKVPVLPIFKSP